MALVVRRKTMLSVTAAFKKGKKDVPEGEENAEEEL